MPLLANMDNDESEKAEAALQFMSAKSPSLPLGTTVQGKCGGGEYVLMSMGAKGGFGEVYKDDHRRVALKRSIWHKPPQARTSRAREAKVSATIVNLQDGHGLPSPRSPVATLLDQQQRLLLNFEHETKIYFSTFLNNQDSRHLTCVHDVALARNSDNQLEPLLVFELAGGLVTGSWHVTLASWLREHRWTTEHLRERLSFGIQMFSGLCELHDGTVAGHPESTVSTQPLCVHQDIKGDNMLLFGDAPRTRLALTDFGLATTPNQTDPVRGGTPCYKAPEQLQHAPVRTSGRDIWATGMVLARLFGGAHTKDAIEAYRQYSRCKMETGKMYELAREISQALETDAAAGWFM